MSLTVIIPPTDVSPTTGTGNAVLATSPTLTTPISATLTSPALTALTLGTGTSGAAITVLSASNNVGIGTASPIQKLDVAGVTGGPAASGTSADGALRLLAASYNMVLDMGVNHAVSSWIQVRDKTNYVTNYDLALQPNGGNVGIGTTTLTGLSGSGGLKLNSSTAGSSGAGALVVQGGISAGQSGQASYFGGAVNAGPVPVDTYALKAIGNTASGQSYGLNIDAGTTTADYSLRIRTATGGNADYFSVRGDGRVTVGNVSSPVATITSTGAATFTDSLIVSGTSPVVLRATGTTDIAVSAISTLADSSAFLYVQNDARQWTMRVNGADADKFNIRDSTAGADRLTIDSAGAATFGGAVTVSGTGTFSGSGGIVLNGATKVIYFGNPSADYLFFNGSDLITRLGNVDRLTIASTGTVSISSTTAGSSGAGALVVQGGLATGAASYFGGDVTAASFYTGTGSSGAAEFKNSASGIPQTIGLFNTSTTANSDVAYGFQTQGSRTCNWLLSRSTGLLEFTDGYQTRGNVRASFDMNTGAATFAGAVAIGNTTAASVAAPSTHKVSILIGGVQFYLLASNV